MNKISSELIISPEDIKKLYAIIKYDKDIKSIHIDMEKKFISKKTRIFGIVKDFELALNRAVIDSKDVVGIRCSKAPHFDYKILALIDKELALI